MQNIRGLSSIREVRRILLVADKDSLVSSMDYQRNLGRYQDEALKHPITITKNGRRRLVVMAVEEYDRLKRRDRRVMGPEDWSDEDLAALERVQYPAGFEHLDEELKDWKP